MDYQAMMNRRSFFKSLLLAPAALLIAPEAVKAATETEKPGIYMLDNGTWARDTILYRDRGNDWRTPDKLEWVELPSCGCVKERQV